MMTLRLQTLKFSLLTQRLPQVLRTAHPTPRAVLRIFGGGASASAEKMLEFKGAKSSFQEGLWYYIGYSDCELLVMATS